jgi:bifunctional enzyme CysN/CysC
VELLRCATAGSIDDGKSTLIGRLLYDSKAILSDQLEAVGQVSRMKGNDYVDLALITDGLQAEQEQGITIDVAYRYFSTSRRRFILADTPGHVQYTRNMATGASTANLAIVLADARKGLGEQSRRHVFLAALLRVPHLVLAVNKMDLVGYRPNVYREILTEFTNFATKLGVVDLAVIPISALHGDNIVFRSDRMPWYQGPSLLHHLENVHVSGDRNLIDARFPVQHVIRPRTAAYADYRGYAGKMAGGVLRSGDTVLVLPSGFSSRIAAIDTADGSVPEAYPPMSVILRLTDDLDVSRGDMICRPNNTPIVTQDLNAMVNWMSNLPLHPGRKLVIKHTTRSTRAVIKALQYRLDVNTLHRVEDVAQLQMNETGRVQLRTTQPLFYDPYQRNRNTGGFIMIDEATNQTVGAGMFN